MTLPTKPEVTIIGDLLAVFMGADYKAMPLDVADKFVRRLQGNWNRGWLNGPSGSDAVLAPKP